MHHNLLIRELKVLLMWIFMANYDLLIFVVYPYLGFMKEPQGNLPINQLFSAISIYVITGGRYWWDRKAKQNIILGARKVHFINRNQICNQKMNTLLWTASLAIGVVIYSEAL